MPMPHRTFAQLAKRRLVGKEGKERIREVRALLAELPDYKNGPYADLRKSLTGELEETRVRARQVQRDSIAVRREGAAQIALVGPPNVGKSSILQALSEIQIKTGDYPFTTLRPVPALTLTVIDAALRNLTGRIQQRPPVYSAMKIGGRRAYQLARRNHEVRLQPRPVCIDRMEIREYRWPVLRLLMDQEFGASNFIANMVWKGATDNNPTRIAIDAEEFSEYGNQLRVRGKVVASLMPDWLSGVYRNDLPQLHGKLKLMPLPAWNEGGLRTSVMGGSMLGVSRRSENIEESWELAKELYLSESAAEHLFLTNGIISPVIRMWESPVYAQPEPYFSNQPIAPRIGSGGGRTSATGPGGPCARTTAPADRPGSTFRTITLDRAPTGGTRTAWPASAIAIRPSASPWRSGTAGTRS
jgi:GTPase SAR1 family protein